MITIKIRFGQDVIEVTGDNAKQVITQAAFFQTLPTTCPVCQSPIKFTYRNPKGFDFYGLECTGPDRHAGAFGIHNNEAKNLFYKQNEAWVAFKDRMDTSRQPD